MTNARHIVGLADQPFETANAQVAEIPSPCFVLEEKLLRRNLEILQDVQNRSGAKIICALKGYALWSTFPFVGEYLTGCTASSLHEARLAYEEMGKEVHAYAVVYPPEEIQEMLGYVGHLTFNSLSEWERHKEVVQKSDKKISCGIRINPEYSEVEVDLYNPCIPGSRFGVTANQLPKKLPKGIEGLHFHTLCENNSYELERTLKAVEKRFGEHLRQARWLNMGGGHHITREDYNRDLLVQLVDHMRSTYDLEEIILEPGEAVGLKTGFLLATVMDIIDSQGIQVAIVDTSFTAHMPDTLEMPYKPLVRGAENGGIAGRHTYRLGGMTCLAGDFMGQGDYSFAEPLAVGDVLIFEDMIHYTMVKTSNFNGIRLPSIGILKEDGSFRHVKTFGYESYKSRLS